jgi:hypothetical protein
VAGGGSVRVKGNIRSPLWVKGDVIGILICPRIHIHTIKGTRHTRDRGGGQVRGQRAVPAACYAETSKQRWSS